MRIAVCPGSFDPVTYGHRDIIKRAAKMFDKVIVLVAVNSAKTPCFTAEERVELIKVVTEGMDNVEIDTFDGLLVDYVKEKGAVAIVKGLRAVTDFENEFQQALANKILYDGAETVFLTTSAENMYCQTRQFRWLLQSGFSRLAGFDKRCVDRLQSTVHSLPCVPELWDLQWSLLY